MTTEKTCLVDGCSGYPSFGYQPLKKVAAKWACREHQHLLVKDSPEPPTIVEDADLFDD